VVYGGTEWHMELENQLSLIKKKYFQLTKDPEIMLFILNYFANEYFSDDGEMWPDYPAFKTDALAIEVDTAELLFAVCVETALPEQS
jgi:hypothetical protein